MDATTFDYWRAQGPWALLFVVVLFVVGRFVAKMLATNQKRDDEHRAESKAREERLMEHNERMTTAVNNLTSTVATMGNQIEKIGSDLKEVKEEFAELKRA